jgi:transposase
MVTMSQKEFQRVKVIENAAGRRLSIRKASRLLQLSERQVQRLKRRYRPDSVGWVQHRNRGRSMPWAVSLPQKQSILSLARGMYQGFNDSHLAEKLRLEENLTVSRETVRCILRAAKMASPQKRRPRQYRSRRPSRPRFGMMALADASRHDWLEGRGPELTLIGFQDDATAQILAAHFQLEAENTLGYLRTLRTMIATHGIPLSLYRDRHIIFQRCEQRRPNSRSELPQCSANAQGKENATHFAPGATVPLRWTVCGKVLPEPCRYSRVSGPSPAQTQAEARDWAK